MSTARPSTATQGALSNHKNPREEPPDHGIGRSRDGLTSKIHLVCDGRGRPLSWVISGGNINDTTMMTATLEQIRVPRATGRPRQRPEPGARRQGLPVQEDAASIGRYRHPARVRPSITSRHLRS
ncbi:transposase [Rhodococcus sp. PAE-6]|uniref:transposase n=1 Tax=Rhodococcus sp. PAE-6 TaxID=2972477 RepID=UPI0034D9713B